MKEAARELRDGHTPEVRMPPMLWSRPRVDSLKPGARIPGGCHRCCGARGCGESPPGMGEDMTTANSCMKVQVDERHVLGSRGAVEA